MLILLNFTLLYFTFLSFSLSTQQSSSISPHTVWLNHRHHHIHQLFHDWLLVSLLEKSSSSRRMICEDLGVWSHTSAPLLLSVLQWQLPQFTFPIWFISAAFVTFISLWRCSNSYPVPHPHHCLYIKATLWLIHLSSLLYKLSISVTRALDKRHGSLHALNIENNKINSSEMRE